MKAYFLAACLLAFCGPAAFAQGKNFFPIKLRSPIRVGGAEDTAPQPAKFTKTKQPLKSQAISFEGERYLLYRSYQDPSGPWVNEYFRPGDNDFDKWQKLISLYYYENSKAAPADTAQAMIDGLKAANPAASYGIVQNEKTGEIIFDYFTWTQGNSVIEFNVFKIGARDGGPIALQFARRWYDEGGGKHERDFMDNFKQLRPAWLAAISATPMPTLYK